jgi:hypothetical protein
MTETSIKAAAAAVDLSIPAKSLPGVKAHLERCAAAAKLIEEFPLPPETEIAGTLSHERL